MCKVLIVATVQSHIAQFHHPLMKLLKERNCEVHVAARNNLEEKNGLEILYADKIIDVPFSRMPINKSNINAYKQIKQLIEEENYDIIHCNTPVGGVVARFAARNHRKNGQTTVLYTAHGFHFYKGASKKNWLVYYPIEKVLAHITDKLITICNEDYQLASEKFKTEVCHIHGVGVDSERYYSINKEEKQILKSKLGFNEDNQLLLCVGELLPNKNQAMVIRAMQHIVKEFPNAMLLIAGNGSNREFLENEVARLKLENNVRFMGYVTNLQDYQQIIDIAVSCSKREGLGLNIIEAMLSSNPVVATKNRGHCELIDDGKNGFLVDYDDVETMKTRLLELLRDPDLKERLGQQGRIDAEKYSTTSVEKELEAIYDSVM